MASRRAVRLVRALASVVEQLFPKGERLAYCWVKYGAEAVDAVRAEDMRQKQKEASRKLIEEGKKETGHAWMWVRLPKKYQDNLIARHPGPGGAAKAKAVWIERLLTHERCLAEIEAWRRDQRSRTA